MARIFGLKIPLKKLDDEPAGDPLSTMKIETLIEKIQTHKYNDRKPIPDDIMDAVKALISRLDGMLPNIDTARTVATKLEIKWSSDPNDPVLAWAWTIWPLYRANRISEVLSVVQQLLPAGQPFGKSEIFDADTNLAMSILSGDKSGARKARARKAEMVDHNVIVGGGALATPDPVVEISAARPGRRHAAN
jgi:hypothetical protein